MKAAIRTTGHWRKDTLEKYFKAAIDGVWTDGFPPYLCDDSYVIDVLPENYHDHAQPDQPLATSTALKTSYSYANAGDANFAVHPDSWGLDDDSWNFTIDELPRQFGDPATRQPATAECYAVVPGTSIGADDPAIGDNLGDACVIDLYPGIAVDIYNP